MRYTRIFHSEETVFCESIAKFLLDLPGVVCESGLIPPITVFNGILNKGEFNAGMSGIYRWSPFEIGEDQFERLVKDLERLADCRYVEPPSWVNSDSDWRIWELEYANGVPSEKHKALEDKVRFWEKKRDLAIKEGRRELAREYDLEAVEAGGLLCKFLDSYLLRDGEQDK